MPTWARNRALPLQKVVGQLNVSCIFRRWPTGRFRPILALASISGEDALATLLDFSALAQRANADGEFALHARFWNATIRLDVGRSRYRLDVRDGIVADCTPWLGSIACDLTIGADETEWGRLLEAIPKPFYQDLYAATVHHGFTVSGDQLNYCAYYPALRRLVELMREARNV